MIDLELKLPVTQSEKAVPTVTERATTIAHNAQDVASSAYQVAAERAAVAGQVAAERAAVASSTVCYIYFTATPLALPLLYLHFPLQSIFQAAQAANTIGERASEVRAVAA